MRWRGRANGYVAQWELACSYAYLEDKESTLKFVDGSFRERGAWLVFIQNEPLFEFLHSDERYRSLVKRVGPPPAW